MPVAATSRSTGARTVALLSLLSSWFLPACATAPVPDATVANESALYSAPTDSDRIGRLLAAVEVNGTGPYRFILDSGANRSALSASLAQLLGLSADAGTTLQIHGVTGSAHVPSTRVAQMRVGDIVLHDQLVPVLPGTVFADADGILGIDGLQDARIEVDFVSKKVNITRSEGRRAPRGYLTVPAKLFNRGLLLVEGRVGNVPTRIIIDTGAEQTIGNQRLLDALVRSSRQARPDAFVIGTTPQVARGATHATPPVLIGEAMMSNLAVTFSDLHVFRLWNLLDEPALIVGMDALGRTQKFVVDYSRQEFHIKTRPQSRATMRNCNSGNCGSRIPAM
jgi:predicted aspartyl protease